MNMNLSQRMLDGPDGGREDDVPDAAWHLAQAVFDPAHAARDETHFALANGMLGVRGGFEEADSPSDGSFLAVAFERTPIHYHERLPGFANSTDTRIPVVEGKRIRIALGDESLDLAAAEWLEFERVLDLRQGCLQRRLRVKTAAGHTIEIRAERVVPFGMSALLAIRFSVRSIDYAGAITLHSSLESDRRMVEQGDDPRIGVAGGHGLVTRGQHADHDGAWIAQRAPHRGFDLLCGQRHRVIGGGLAVDGTHAGLTRVGQSFRGDLQPGLEISLEKFVAYAWTGDEAARHADLDAALTQATDAGFAALATRQSETLGDFWRRADISVRGDDKACQALRFNLFHLLQSAGRDGISGTAAKGLTGEGYEGHCFWDTEVFVLPVMVFTAPDVARTMLQFRHRTLDAARAHAREMNHPVGALYPWRTIDGGECSAHYPSGSAAYHINAAIAYAIGLYWDATADLDFMCAAGAEMLFETARIWLQVGHFSPRKGGAFSIHEVTGPDEYTAMVNNNYYTNRMAQKHLQRAAAIWEMLAQARPDALEELTGRLGLGGSDVTSWRRAAEAMYLPYDDALGVIAQDDEFLDKPRWPFRRTAGSHHRPLLLDHHPLTLYRHQVCKQADAVMALALAGDGIDLASKRRTFDYYEAITTHDSTLSAPVFGILAAEVGYPGKAWRYFDASVRVDLDDLHGNTDHGVHMAALAGSWLGVVEGFAGLRVHEGVLTFHPMAPEALQGYGFNLHWRGSVLRVDVGHDGVRYAVVAGARLTLLHAGERIRLAPGEDALRPLRARETEAKASFPRPCAAVVFDLDGVLTDTARIHYEAWKRLADEIGVPFDVETNERLKGVDRMASLDIILERAARPYSQSEKEAMAARKNGYYVAMIDRCSPQDLFPGVKRILAELRTAGVKTGLASASRNAAKLLERLGIAEDFDYVADAARITHAKPDPEIFLDVAHALGVPPSVCIGVEDAAAGITAIHAAGMAAVGIGDARALHEADAVLPSIADFDIARFVSPRAPAFAGKQVMNVSARTIVPRETPGAVFNHETE